MNFTCPVCDGQLTRDVIKTLYTLHCPDNHNPTFTLYWLSDRQQIESYYIETPKLIFANIISARGGYFWRIDPNPPRYDEDIIAKGNQFFEPKEGLKFLQRYERLMVFL